MDDCCCYLAPKTPAASAIFNMMKQADGALQADIKIVGSSERSFLVHSRVMATLSSKFNKIVASMNISSMELDFTDEAIIKLIELAYAGTTTPAPQLEEELLQIATQFSITSLTKICSDFLLRTLSPGNWEQRCKLGKKSL